MPNTSRLTLSSPYDGGMELFPPGPPSPSPFPGYNYPVDSPRAFVPPSASSPSSRRALNSGNRSSSLMTQRLSSSHLQLNLSSELEVPVQVPPQLPIRVSVPVSVMQASPPPLPPLPPQYLPSHALPPPPPPPLTTTFLASTLTPRPTSTSSIPTPIPIPIPISTGVQKEQQLRTKVVRRMMVYIAIFIYQYIFPMIACTLLVSGFEHWILRLIVVVTINVGGVLNAIAYGAGLRAASRAASASAHSSSQLSIPKDTDKEINTTSQTQAQAQAQPPPQQQQQHQNTYQAVGQKSARSRPHDAKNFV